MSQADHVARGLHGQFHPVSHYNDPGDVLRDTALSAAEKRVILSSWASDMFAVESNPTMREVPGIAHPIRLSDILSALRRLDGDDNDPPPRGGAVMPFPRPMSSLNVVARKRASSPQPRLAAAASG
jgi:hypothetical protein